MLIIFIISWIHFMLFDENSNRYLGLPNINRALFEDYWVIESTLYNIFCELSTNANLFVSQFQILVKMNEFLAIRFCILTFVADFNNEWFITDVELSRLILLTYKVLHVIQYNVNHVGISFSDRFFIIHDMSYFV